MTQVSISVDDVFNDPSAYVEKEVKLRDVAVAQSSQQLQQDLCWMLSKKWLDASSNPADAVMNHSRAIQLCQKFLSADIVETVGVCGGWPVDAYSLSEVQGTLTEGTDGFAYKLINLKSMIVEGQDILNTS